MEYGSLGRKPKTNQSRQFILLDNTGFDESIIFRT